MRAPESLEESVRSARELLGVPADADASQLARAYRRQARRLHPDISLEPDATEQFWTLQAAYQIALDAARSDIRPRSEVPPGKAPTGVERVEHRGRTFVLGNTPPGGVPSITWPEREGVDWLAAGPVHVQPPRRPDPGPTATSSGTRP
jgi:DnaJ domain